MGGRGPREGGLGRRGRVCPRRRYIYKYININIHTTPINININIHTTHHTPHTTHYRRLQWCLAARLTRISLLLVCFCLPVCIQLSQTKLGGQPPGFFRTLYDKLGGQPPGFRRISVETVVVQLCVLTKRSIERSIEHERSIERSIECLVRTFNRNRLLSPGVGHWGRGLGRTPGGSFVF